MRQALRLAQHRPYLSTVVAAEVATDPLAQVCSFPDVEHLVVGTDEAVHAGGARQVMCELQLAGLGVPAHLGQHDQIVQAQHPEAGRAFQQQVQQVSGGERVVQCTVTGAMVETEAAGQCAELAVRHFITHQAARKSKRVHDGVAQRRPVAAQQRGVDEAHVEADVVTDDHGFPDEFLQGRQYRFDPRC